MNLCLIRIPLFLIAGFTLFISCKKENPNPSNSSVSVTSCQLDSSFGSPNPPIGSYVYTYNSNKQVISVLFSYNGGNPITYQYDSQGRPITSTIAGGDFTSFMYDSKGNLSRVNNTQNGSLDGYTLYTYNGSTNIEQSVYTALGILSQITLYTISGYNIVQSLETDYDKTGLKILATQLELYSGFDSNFNPLFVAYQSWPATAAILLNGVSRNNPTVHTEIYTLYTNGVAGASNSTITYSTYTYNNSGAVLKEIDTITSIGVAPSILTTNYAYSSCN